MTTIVRRFQFCAGHRVFQHESKCRNLHGHNYVLLAEVSAPDLDALGRVMDFSVVKEKLGGWIDQHWDHGFICFGKDHEVHGMLLAFNDLPGEEALRFFCLPYNPTAENLARFLLTDVGPVVFKDTGCTLTKVTLWETENCAAILSLDQL